MSKWYLLLGVVCVVAAFSVLAAWLAAGSNRPETLTTTSFKACGQSYELINGYLAFDHGSRSGAEVPPGHTIFNVQSAEPGATPPWNPDGVFRSWPGEISELVVGEPYADWLQAIAIPVDPTLTGRSVVVGGFSYDDDSCRVSVHLVAQDGRLEPRPGDWAIVIYESRDGDTVIGDDLEEWRSSGVTD